MGDIVFFTAFLKQDKTKFFVCRGKVIKTPEKKERQVYRVKIEAVATHSVGGPDEFNQASMIGMTITKKFIDLQAEIPEFMRPKSWVGIIKDG